MFFFSLSPLSVNLLLILSEMSLCKSCLVLYITCPCMHNRETSLPQLNIRTGLLTLRNNDRSGRYHFHAHLRGLSTLPRRAPTGDATDPGMALHSNNQWQWQQIIYLISLILLLDNSRMRLIKYFYGLSRVFIISDGWDTHIYINILIFISHTF